METVTREFKVYQYSELDQEAQNKVQNWIAESSAEFEHSELQASLFGLAENLGVSIKDYSLGYDRGTFLRVGYFKLTKEEIQELKDNKDKCLITGVCYDIDFIEAFLDNLPKKDITEDHFCNAFELLSDTYSKLFYSAMYEQDLEEICDSNEYRFLADGSIF